MSAYLPMQLLIYRRDISGENNLWLTGLRQEMVICTGIMLNPISVYVKDEVFVFDIRIRMFSNVILKVVVFEYFIN